MEGGRSGSALRCCPVLDTQTAARGRHRPRHGGTEPAGISLSPVCTPDFLKFIFSLRLIEESALNLFDLNLDVPFKKTHKLPLLLLNPDTFEAKCLEDA